MQNQQKVNRRQSKEVERIGGENVAMNENQDKVTEKTGMEK